MNRKKEDRQRKEKWGRENKRKKEKITLKNVLKKDRNGRSGWSKDGRSSTVQGAELLRVSPGGWDELGPAARRDLASNRISMPTLRVLCRFICRFVKIIIVMYCKTEFSNCDKWDQVEMQISCRDVPRFPPVNHLLHSAAKELCICSAMAWTCRENAQSRWTQD